MSIILEVTRKCNLSCEHCLRGSAENKTISDLVLSQLAKEDLYSLTLTGGEPTLVPDIFQKFRQYRIFPEKLWFCTNGKVFKKTFIEEYASFIYDFKVDGCFAVSTDPYHDTDRSNYHKYCDLAESLGLERPSEHGPGYENTIEEGRCAYGKQLSEMKYEWDQEVNEDIYITVDGDVLYGCNWSYKRMKKLVLGNIKDESIKSIIKRNEKTYRKVYDKVCKIPYNEL